MGVRHPSVHELRQDGWLGPESEFVVTVEEQAPVRTGWVQTEGDKLYYEERGRGRPLLMISGGGGDAGFYGPVASMLADEFRVITYDRRANSRSTRHEPQNFEVSQQARDRKSTRLNSSH